MPDWSRRDVVVGFGAAATLGGGYYLAERPFCRPRHDPQWTYDGEYWGPAVASEYGLLVPEGYSATGGGPYRLVALDRSRGQARWATVARGGGFGVPAVHEGTVYVGTGVDTVRAHDATTGRLRWEYDAGGVEEHGGGAWGRPLVTDGRVYAGVSHAANPDADPTDGDAFTHRVVALDADDGGERWSHEVTTQVWTGPVGVAGVVVVGSVGGVLRGFDPESGDVRWTATLPGTVRRRPVVVGDTVTVVTGDGTVTSVDAATGAKRDSTRAVETAGERRAATAVASHRGTVYVGGQSGRVVALTSAPAASEWPVRWTFDTGVPVGAIAAGEAGVFVVDHSGRLHALTDDGERRQHVGLVETRGDRCEWRPDRRFVRSAVLEGERLTVSTNWWTRRFGVRDL
ncbi:outer membrane protein assembly factor BamB family protein [Halogeometricum limi]|uniref:PQQ-like domain-containing protein n=1 Tax=Halogeometricum limi TaxID=555875 RepID=A0A1I6H626_9EURY|nr:PQQ-binding-like beta-propeller repeat protein [Halogeometricum limi]SFR49787.1 PQQ-like domain-containing protein [Halogeometricum limi]